MSIVVRSVGYIAWAIAFGLSVMLVLEFHQGQNEIATGVAILALILSAFGLILARYSWTRGDWLAMGLGLLVWAAGAISFTVTELGYWASTYGERHAQYLEVKTAKARQEILKDQAWKALTTGEMLPSPAQLEAEIEAARQNERWGSTKSCTNATVRPSQEFCEGYFNLKAQLAGAIRRQELESQLISEQSKAKGALVNDVFAQAELFARRLGGEEKDWADFIIAAAWIVLLLARDTGLIIANPLGRSQRALQPPKAAPVSGDTEKPETPALDAKEIAEAAIERVPEVRTAVVGDIRRNPLVPWLGKPAPRRNPTPPETPSPVMAAKPADLPEAEEEKPAAVHLRIASSNDEAQEKLIARRREKPKRGRPVGKVLDWVAETTSQVSEGKIKTASTDCHANYLAWCQTNDLHHLPLRVFTRKLTAHLKLKNAKRNVNGQRLFPGLLLSDPVSWQSQQRAVA